MNEIAAGVFQSHVPGATLPPYKGTECYWVGSPGEVILVDSGDGSDRACATLEDDWTRLGRPHVRAIYASHFHPDHTGGGNWAHKRWAAPLYLHQKDIEAMVRRGKPSGLWQHHETGRFTIGGLQVTLMEAPGHTPGQWNFWLPNSRGLLAGDNVLGDSTVVIVPPDGELHQYLNTLAKLQALNPSWIGPGHGTLVREPAAYLAYYASHREERSQEILRLLERGVRTPEAIASVIYADKLTADTMHLGMWMVKGHLQHLLALRQVAVDKGIYERKF